MFFRVYPHIIIGALLAFHFQRNMSQLKQSQLKQESANLRRLRRQSLEEKVRNNGFEKSVIVLFFIRLCIKQTFCRVLFSEQSFSTEEAKREAETAIEQSE